MADRGPEGPVYSRAMQYAESILDLVGRTPLVRLSRVTRDLGPVDRQPLILAKLEMLNPGGSVKDRIGLPMIEAAGQAGLRRPGGTIIKPDQYWNLENPTAHARTTGPEIWEQTEGRVTHFVCSVGTGGTITGAAHFLRAKNPDLIVIGADPEGSVLSGDIARPYLTEGVGEDFFPGTFDPQVVDRWVRVSDRDAFAAARRITREEGILAGESCGTALVAALEIARELTGAGAGPAAIMVVLLPDGGRSYMSKLYNDEWMRVNGLLPTAGGIVRVAELLAGRHHDPGRPAIVVARTTERVGSAIETLQTYGISQMPVSEDAEGEEVAGIVGSISEKGLLDRAFRDASVVDRTVGEGMDPPLPLVDASATLDEAFTLLSGGSPAVVAVRGERPAGVVTKLDLLEYLAHHASGRG